MAYEKKYKARSDSYQYLINEICVDMAIISETVDLDGRLHTARYSPRFAELNDMAFQRILDIAEQCLTEHQFVVAKLYLKGLTQQEMAKELNVNQSSITKSLMGNTDYKRGKNTYGGVSKKMRKNIKQDQILKDIILEMRTCDDTLINKSVNHNNYKVEYNSEYQVNSNIYYLISTLFKDDDRYYEWMTNYIPPAPTPT